MDVNPGPLISDWKEGLGHLKCVVFDILESSCSFTPTGMPPQPPLCKTYAQLSHGCGNYTWLI